MFRQKGLRALVDLKPHGFLGLGNYSFGNHDRFGVIVEVIIFIVIVHSQLPVKGDNDTSGLSEAKDPTGHVQIV